MSTFDYTAANNPDTFKGGALQGYRLMHWMADVLRNWFSDPINIKDERISKLLHLQDGNSDEELKALFDIGTPFVPDTKKACATPMLLVGLGDTVYPVNQISNAGSPVIAETGAMPMYLGLKFKTIALTIAVLTESYDGTVLLAGLVEDFLNINEQLLVSDNAMISSLKVRSVSAPKDVKQGTAANAKPVYQSVIQVACTGGISWTTDTQGPVYRGMAVNIDVK